MVKCNLTNALIHPQSTPYTRAGGKSGIVLFSSFAMAREAIGTDVASGSFLPSIKGL